MSLIRKITNPSILALLREHDRLPENRYDDKLALQRRILFLMTSVKLYEREERLNEHYGVSETPEQSTCK